MVELKFMTNCSSHSIAAEALLRLCRQLSTSSLSLWALLLLASASGCAFGGTFYNAHEMPQSLVAAHNENTRTLDLSKLSTGDGSTNTIAPGDLLEVTIAAGLSQREVNTMPVRVTENGVANVGMIGQVRLAGLSLEDADVAIAESCVRNGMYRAPNVTVSFKRRRMNRVTVLGAVNKPGTVLVPTSESDLLSVLTAAGSLAEDAGNNVEIRNAIDLSDKTSPVAGGAANGVTQTGYAGGPGSGKSYKIDLISAVKKGTNSYYIADGGVVYVEKRDPQAIHVTGLVKKPGRQDFPVSEDLTMLGALSQAGHVSNSVADKVYVIRRPNGSTQPVVILCSIARAKREEAHNVLLAPGDIVSVEHTPATVFMEIINIVKVGATASLNPLLF